MVKIFIDPGHGGTDPGAVGNGLQEKTLTLLISKKIRDFLNQYNCQVRLSREGDQTLSLTQRTNMANAWDADFFLSIHINAGGGTGYEDFRHTSETRSSASGRAQNTIHTAVISSIRNYNVVDRGQKSANFAVIRESDMPALLTENLFIDRASDAALLKNNAFLDAIARGHVSGLVQHFRLTSKQPPVPRWGDMELRRGQIGRLTILRPINLWTEDAAGNLELERILQPNEIYRVYGFRQKHGGQYDVGGGHWVTNIPGYIRYETPSKSLLAQAEEYYD